MHNVAVQRPPNEVIQQALNRLQRGYSFSPALLSFIEQEMAQVFERAQHLQRLEFYRADAAARGAMDLHG